MGVEKVAVEVIKLDSEAKTVTAKDKFGTEFVFHYESKTRIRTTGTRESVTPVAILIMQRVPLPLRPGQDTVVKWKPDSAKKQRTAIEFVVFE